MNKLMYKESDAFCENNVKQLELYYRDIIVAHKRAILLHKVI